MNRSTSSETSQTSNTLSRAARWLLLLGILLILLWAGLKGWRIVQAGRSLLERQTEAEQLLEAGPMNADPAAVEELLLGMRGDVVTLKEETAVFLPLAPYLTWLPQVGPLMPDAPHLMQMADAGAALAVHGWAALEPTLPLLQDADGAGMEQIAALLPILQEAQPELVAAQRELARYQTARAQLSNPEALPAQAEALLAKADKWLPLAEDGLHLAPVLPALLGQNGPRRYLVIAQNEDELRPTGGFISGAGVLTVQNGRIADLSFMDANLVDNWQEKPYAFPPQPLYDLMGLELFLFRDANFWPHFPTSATAAMELYRYGQDAPPLDGAIAFDQRFVQMLVGALGSVPIPAEGVTINRNNIIEVMRATWGDKEDQTFGEWVLNRKAFFGVFATAILEQIQTDFDSIDPLYLADTMYRAIEGKHLLIHANDPEVAAALGRAGWNGRVTIPAGQDMWMAVDTNVGYNKVNVFVERRLRYQVDLTTPSAPQAELALTYTHTGEPQAERCFQGTPYTEDVTYLGRADNCYWNYLRLYVPPGSQLEEATSHTIPGDTTYKGDTWDRPAQTITDPPGLTAFANAFLLPRADSLTTRFRYRLPADVVSAGEDGSQYRLTVYKQAGASVQPLQIVLQLPPNAIFQSATPAPTQVANNAITFDTTLETDLSFVVRYTE